MTACGPLCGPMTGGAASLPLPAGSGRCGPVVGGVAAQGFQPFLHGTEGRKKKQDKRRGRRWRLRPVTTARSAGSYGSFGCIKSGFMGKKERFAFYLTPEKKAILERRYQEDGSRSMTAFVERAVDFYLDYLSANDAGLFLPTSIKSYLDGRLGQLEERLSSLAFRQAVEQDMVAGILADAYQFSDEDLRRRRSESVQNVKKTNGRVSLEQRVRGAWEEGDEWQD